SGTIFTGLQHVWRTKDNGGPQSFLDSVCNIFLPAIVFDPNGNCGDWVAIGANLSTGFGTDKAPGQYIVATERAPSDSGTLWVGLRRGRVFLSSNADESPNAVVFYRIDSSSTPTRFVSGIAVDPSNPNHAFISFSGYNAYASATGTATGHVFEVDYDPTSHTASWTNLDKNLGDQPITGIALDRNTGDLFVSTDFGVNMLKSGASEWTPAAANLPPVAVYGLTIDSNARILYAATHGRGAWSLELR
ncbi:MAG: exo-alpha-sialidase, partial [Acidobacteria bacterium]|nr:exo-alpha-sialidase [Acidobacteriota bacterium]